MKIKLFTTSGGFVHEGMIPAFNRPPSVIFWGGRVFECDPGTVHDGVVRYVEAFAFTLIS